MTRWIFSRHSNSLKSIDAREIQTHALANSTESEIAKIDVETDSGPWRLGDVFKIRRLVTANNTSDLQVVVEGDVTNCHYLGYRHASGEFIIDGSAGDHVGHDMRGGQLVVHGDVRNHLGSMLRSGQVKIGGNAGDFVAGPQGTSAVGMRGGWVHVSGNVGDYAGHRMRRGCLTVGGNAGSLVSSQMIAGTVVIAGTLGDQPAYGMRRGTLIVSRMETLAERFSSPRFSESVAFHSVFGTLLARELERLAPLPRPVSDLCRRLKSGNGHSRRGDRAVGGKGEIIVPG